MVKAQASLLVLLGMVIVTVVALVFFYFTNVEFSERVIKNFQYFKISTYLDYTKFFSRISLYFSTHSAVDEIAKRGGIAGTPESSPRSWICNQLDIPTVDEVRFFLSEETMKFMNYYINNFKSSDILRINLSKVSCTDLKVTQADVDSGNYDEGFDILGLGSNISIGIGQENVSSIGDMTERISFLRFWYMYRKFKEWTNSYGVEYVTDICSALSTICSCSGYGDCSDCTVFQTAVNAIAQDKLNKLNAVFSDPYISCYYEITCCSYKKDNCVSEYQGCTAWTEDPTRCKECVNKNTVPFSDSCGKKLGFDSCSGSCDYWAEVKGAVKVTFGCNDTKYFVSTPNGTQPLIFKVDVTASQKKIDCYKTFPCQNIPQGSADPQCIETVPGSGICYWVYPELKCDCPDIYCTKDCQGANTPQIIDGECECQPPPLPPNPPTPPGPTPPTPPTPPPPPQPPGSPP